MNKIFHMSITILLASFFAIPLQVAAQQNCAIDNKYFQSGENLTYDLYITFAVTVKGGYANLRGAAEASTSATAAAMMVRGQLAGYSGDASGGDDLAALRGFQDASGGFGATAAAPVPDLLSTAVALFALRQWGVAARWSAADFVEAHWLADGGFAATLMDGAGDTEYTFYGLLALGSL